MSRLHRRQFLLLGLSSAAAGCAGLRRLPVTGARARLQQEQLVSSIADVAAGSALADQQAAGTLYLFFKDPHSLWVPHPVGRHDG